VKYVFSENGQSLESSKPRVGNIGVFHGVSIYDFLSNWNKITTINPHFE
jgi:hypothetical protein